MVQGKTGIFITFEGGEGVGKSTHIRFLEKALRDQGIEVVRLREPGGTAIGEALREIVLSTENAAMTERTELLIYEAARAQLVHDVILPALKRGAVVLSDRFTDSTLAYQGYGRGIDPALIGRLNDFATGGVVPDRTLLLVCGPEDGLARATRHSAADRLESAGSVFHDQVNAGFAELAKAEPDRVRIIDSVQGKSATARMIFENLSDLFPWMADPAIVTDDYFAALDLPKNTWSGKGIEADVADV